MKTKHIILQSIPLLMVLLSCISCDEYRDQFELDDQLYLQKSGLTEMTVFNWGTFTYELPVIKSGKGNHPATVRLSIDESILSEYNTTNGTDYKLMPENCYKLQSPTLSLTEKDYRAFFLIDFDPEVLTALAAEGGKFALPCRMETENTSIQIAEEERSSVLLLPSVQQPYIGFETTFYATGSEFSIKTDDDDIQEIFPKVRVNYYNDWDISYEVKINPEVLDAYNESNPVTARDYVLLPEGAYEIDYSTCLLKTNRDYEYLKITLKEEALRTEGENYAFGYYAIPLQITSVSQYGIDPNAQTTIYPVSIQPPVMDKKNWVISTCNSIITDEVENASSTQVPANVLDNNTNTYWTTKAIHPTEFPYYVEINLQETCKLYRLGFQLPDNAELGNIKSGYFEASVDGDSWTKVAEWNRRSNAEDRSMELDFSMLQANFIRFVITDAFVYADAAVGKASGAVCQVAEINAWGI